MSGLVNWIFDGRRILGKDQPVGEIPPAMETFRTAVKVAWPSILESFLVALVGVMDTIMVGTVGTEAIAAVGLCTQPKFIALAIFMSMNVAVSAIVARRKGEGNREDANAVMRQALVVTLILMAVISTLTVVFAPQILAFAGSNADTHDDAVIYYRIIMGGLVFNVVSLVINAAQRGVGNTKIAMRTNMVSNGVNICFNYLLIGGNFGFPRLEVAGAAIATVLGTVFAMGMSIASVMHPDGYLHLSFRNFFRFEKRTLSSLWNVGSGTLAEQLFARIGFLAFAVVVANLGTIPFAAHQIGMNIISISFSLGDGLSVAAVALVGQSLGRGRPDMARVYGGTCQRIGLFFSVMVSIIFITQGRLIFSLFDKTPAVLEEGVIIMRFAAAVVFFQISQVVFSGCLRGAGDVRYMAVVSLVSATFVRPTLGWFFCYGLGLGITGAWMGLATDQFLRLFFTAIRFLSGKWTRIKI